MEYKGQYLNRVEPNFLQEDILNLLKILKSELTYEYVIVWSKMQSVKFIKEEGCLFDSLIGSISDEPFMVLGSAFINNDNLASDKLSKTALMLSCWDQGVDATRTKLIEVLVGHLIWARNEIEISDICKYFKDDIKFNEFIVEKNSIKLQIVYTCNMGDPEKLNFTTLVGSNSLESIYMRGSKIVTESDQLPPRSIVYRDNAGNLRMDGYVANCVTTFAERYHATLVITPPMQVGQAVFYDMLLNKTSQGLIDIPAIVTPFKGDSYRLKNIYYSYPLEIMDLCYMIPLPRLIENKQVFTYIIDTYVMIVITGLFVVYGILLTIGTQKSARHLSLSSVLLNDKSIRILLGQSFVMPTRPCLFMKYVCFLLCYTSLIISTTYQAYLQSHLIHPAYEKRIETYDDMRKAGLKILTSTQESDFMESSVYNANEDLFIPQDPYDQFLKLRATMDTRYVYPVSNSRWEVFKQQQRLFQKALFYFSPNLCLKKQALLAVPIPQNKPYKALFNKHILELWELGLMQHWIQINFYTMVLRNYTTFEDLSTPEEIGDAIELYDFIWVWTFFGGFLLLSSLVFLGELLVYFIFSTKYKFLK
ncbi:uncharacterized protein LOC106081911 [Stomoxys calcitrans]|uniref:uncharacterized protein LOC106081911 n=1 Tax=Stomoxys calcitrans TaxID=35570 RepID=UPI0027E3A137|nr:uncharacterized protein LOC106081911 [Stomoxys calcitrans]